MSAYLRVVTDLNTHRVAETAYPLLASLANAVSLTDDDVSYCALLTIM